MTVMTTITMAWSFLEDRGKVAVFFLNGRCSLKIRWLVCSRVPSEQCGVDILTKLVHCYRSSYPALNDILSRHVIRNFDKHAADEPRVRQVNKTNLIPCSMLFYMYEHSITRSHFLVERKNNEADSRRSHSNNSALIGIFKDAWMDLI